MAGKKAGRKSKAEEMGLKALLDKCWSPQARAKCIKKLAEDCESSEFQVRNESRKLLMAYTFGKPTEKHEVSNPDGSPLLAPVADALTKIYGK